MKRRLLSALRLMLLLGLMNLALTASAQAEILFFNAPLLPGNEVAPVVVHATEANSSGTASITLDVTRGANNAITAATARFDFVVNGLPTTSRIVAAHIHIGAAGTNGPVRVDSGISANSPINIAGNNQAVTRLNLPVTNEIAQMIIDNPAGFYFNIHTALSPGGVMRGQLATSPTATVPTLSEWGAILMFLLMLAAGTYFLVGRGSFAALGPEVAAGHLAEPIKPLDLRLLVKVTLAVEGVILLGLLLLSSVVTMIDVGGALVSGLVIAFTLHLMIGRMRR